MLLFGLLRTETLTAEFDHLIGRVPSTELPNRGKRELCGVHKRLLVARAEKGQP